MTLSFDLEWNREGIIDVLGLAWNDGRSITATSRSDETLGQFLSKLNNAERLAAHNGIDADIMQLARNGVDTSMLLPKVFDTRLGFYACNGHLAGSGSFDLRSVMLLLGSRQSHRFPLEFKQYATDLHRTCALDAGAVSWAVPLLDSLIAYHKVEKTVEILHKCSPIFARMREQGVRLDKRVLEQIHGERKKKTEEIIERYHLWEERGKKVIKKVPIWRSDKVLDIFETNFGVRPKDRQRLTWTKLLPSLTPEAREFAEAIIDLGQGANDAHWLGKAEENAEGIEFDKVESDGFIHPRYDICGSPDRAIASGPNIQNFPRPADDPRPIKLRSAVIPLRDDHVILGADLSSVETITNAIESNDWDRVEATLAKRISHEGTAAIINQAFGLSLNRSQGKAINHGFDKGESPYNLARTLFKTDRPARQHVRQCEDIFQRMLSEFPRTAQFRDDLWERAKGNPLTVTNKFGRRLQCFSRAKYGDVSERYAKHNPARKYWCSCGECSPRRDRWKYAIAFLGRSAAFDALLRIMARIYYEKRLDEFSLPFVECHDELLYSIPKGTESRYMQIAKEAFEEPFEELGGVSLPANAVIGNSWMEAH